MENKENMIRIAVAISFCCMLIINVLSFIIPFNGRNVAEVSSFYPNYVTPSNVFFSMWVLIHIFSGCFAVYQLISLRFSHINAKTLFFARITFLIYCWLDIVWLIAWVYDYLALAIVVILSVLICVKLLCRSLCSLAMNGKERFFIRIPFSLLYGWLTVTTVMNIVILFVSINWKGFSIPIMYWELVLMAGITVFAVYRTLKNRDIVYCLTILWYYIGLLVRQLIAAGSDRRYPIAIGVDLFCIILLAGCTGYLLFGKKKSV